MSHFAIISLNGKTKIGDVDMGIFQLFRNKPNPPDIPQHICLSDRCRQQYISQKRLSYQAANLQGIGCRECQEDAFAFVNVLDVTRARKEGMLAVVADGMGGMADGKWAGETVVASIKTSFSSMDMAADISEQLEESIRKASSDVFKKLQGMGGSTVIAGIFYEDELYFASVGDSVLYLRRNDRMFRLNRVHTIKNKKYLEQIYSGNLLPKQAREDPEAAALAQFMGMKGLDTIDSAHKPLPLMNGDVILLCTDGVTGVLDEEKIGKCLSEGSPVCMSDLLEKGIRDHAGLYQDNYTALIITCSY